MLPLQWPSPEGVFSWSKINPGATALTYMWLHKVEAHAHPLSLHLLLTMEEEAVTENVRTHDRQDQGQADKDNVVWMKTHAHTTPSTVAHHWQAVIIRLRGDAPT